MNLRAKENRMKIEYISIQNFVRVHSEIESFIECIPL